MEVKLFLSDILKKTDIDPKNIMLIRHVLSNDKCREYVDYRCLRLIIACRKHSVKERQHEKARNVGDFVEITPES